VGEINRSYSTHEGKMGKLIKSENVTGKRPLGRPTRIRQGNIKKRSQCVYVH
jgi:hypothetical protein